MVDGLGDEAECDADVRGEELGGGLGRRHPQSSRPGRTGMRDGRIASLEIVPAGG